MSAISPITPTPAPSASMSLWEIDAELQFLMEQAHREEIEGSVLPKTRTAIETYFIAAVTKADNIAVFVKHQKGRVAELTEEKRRVDALLKSETNALERCKTSLLNFMVSRGIDNIRGKLNKIRTQTNSVDSLDIEDESVLPDDHTLVTVKLPTSYFLANIEVLPIVGSPSPIEPNNGSIRAALLAPQPALDPATAPLRPGFTRRDDGRVQRDDTGELVPPELALAERPPAVIGCKLQRHCHLRFS